MKQCIKCYYARIDYDENKGYICYCKKHKKEVGFYFQCQEYK